MNKNIARLFAPRSIAVVGASQDTKKISTTIFTNIISGGFAGKVIPVNPRYDSVLGHKCYPAVSAIPFRVDMVIIAVPARHVEAVLLDCAGKKIKHAVIISAGFGESGAKGAALEGKLGQIAKDAGVEILGPNCLGLIVPGSKLNASFAANQVAPGSTAFMSQSGAVGTAILDMAAEDGFGFSHFVSLGNKLDINENDLLAYWLQSSEVSVIAAYLESYQDGLEFITAKSRLGIEKPVVVVSPGKSKTAVAAVSSHTGSVTSPSDVVETALRKNGFTQVQNLNDAYALMQTFTWLKPFAGERVGVITNAGGIGAIAADILAQSNLELATLTPAASNPIDVLGDAGVDRFQQTITQLEQDPGVDSILLLLSPQLVTQLEETAKLILSRPKNAKPLIPVFVGGKYVRPVIQRLKDNRIPAFMDVQLAVTCLNALVDYGMYLAAGKKTSQLAQVTTKQQARLGTAEASPVLEQQQVWKLLDNFGFKQPQTAIIHNWEEAEAFAKKVSFPLVIKARNEELLHKTEFKAVFTNIEDLPALKAKLTVLQENIYKHTGKGNPPVIIQQYIDYEQELFVGIKRDGDSDVYKKSGKGFGHLFVFGKGGIYTEIYQDYAKALVPMTKSDVLSLIKQTKISQIIEGFRGQQKLPVDKLVNLILKLQEMVVAHPEIVELDANPVLIDKKDCYLVDVKILIRD